MMGVPCASYWGHLNKDAGSFSESLYCKRVKGHVVKTARLLSLFEVRKGEGRRRARRREERPEAEGDFVWIELFPTQQESGC